MGSPFARLITKVVELKHDAPNTVTIQKLSGRAVERAQSVAAERIVNGRGFAEKITRALEAAKDGSDAKLMDLLGDPLKGYDRHTLLVNGITAWSYEQPCDGAAIAELDDETSELLAIEILQLTKPQLFADPETARKNA